MVETSPQDEAVTAGAPQPNDAVETDDGDLTASAGVMNLLTQHVPLALLADLASPTGPASPAILEAEGLPDRAWWDAEGDEDARFPDLVPDEPDEVRPGL